MPPLREREGDIPLLAKAFLQRYAAENKKKIKGFTPQAVRAMETHNWQGNIRELENLIERAFIIESSSILTPAGFPLEFFALESPLARIELDSSYTLAEVRRRALEEVEKRYLKELLANKKGKIRESAEVAGITTRQLHKLLTKYGIKKEDFKSRTSQQ